MLIVFDVSSCGPARSCPGHPRWEVLKTLLAYDPNVYAMDADEEDERLEFDEFDEDSEDDDNSWKAIAWRATI